MRRPLATARRRRRLHQELTFFLALAASAGACGPQADRTGDPQASGASDAARAEPSSHVFAFDCGEEASLERDGQTVACVMNRRASTIEAAKLNGMDFWATGNEPGWTLEIGSETSVLVMNYAEDRYEFAAPEPSVDAETRRTLYELDLDGRALVIELTGEECFDSMSGERFETTVTLKFGGRSYPGCGQALH